MEAIQVKFIIDNDICKHNEKIDDCIIYHIDRIPEELRNRNYLVLVSTVYFETETNDIMVALINNGMKKIMYPFAKQYGLAPYRYEWAYYYSHHENELLETYRILGDDKSREIMFEYVRAILTNCVYKGKHEKSHKKYLEEYVPLKDECFLNIGSYVGDTIFHFLENRQERFEKIYAIEGNSNIYRRLSKNLAILPSHILNKIELSNTYIDENSARNYEAKRITLVNMDIEGMEKEVIMGLKTCIMQNRPVLAICAYHKPEDIVELPLLIREIVDGYKIIFRKYAPPYSNHLENGELVMYGIPKEREIEGK